MLKQELAEYAGELVKDSSDVSKILKLGYNECELKHFIEFLLKEGAYIAQKHVKARLELLP